MSLPITALGTATGPLWQHRIERSGVFSPWVNWSDTSAFTTDPDGGAWRYNTPYWLYARNPTLPPFSQGSLENEIASTFYITSDGEVRYEAAPAVSDPDVTGGDYSFKPGNGEDATGWQYRLERADNSTAWRNWTNNLAFSQDPLGGNLMVDTLYWVYGRNQSLPAGTPGATDSELAAAIRIRADGSVESIDPASLPANSPGGGSQKTLLQLAKATNVAEEMLEVLEEFDITLAKLIKHVAAVNLTLTGVGNYLTLRKFGEIAASRGHYHLDELGNGMLLERLFTGINNDGHYIIRLDSPLAAFEIGPNLTQIRTADLSAPDTNTLLRTLSLKVMPAAKQISNFAVIVPNPAGKLDLSERSPIDVAADLRPLFKYKLSELIEHIAAVNIALTGVGNYLTIRKVGDPSANRGHYHLDERGDGSLNERLFTGLSSDGHYIVRLDSPLAALEIGPNLTQIRTAEVSAPSSDTLLRTLSVKRLPAAQGPRNFIVSDPNPAAAKLELAERSPIDVASDLAPYFNYSDIANKVRPYLTGEAIAGDARVIDAIFCFTTPVPIPPTQSISVNANVADGYVVPHLMQTTTPFMRVYTRAEDGTYYFDAGVTYKPTTDKNNLTLNIPGGGGWQGVLKLEL